jgi:hypothetical protein
MSLFAVELFLTMNCSRNLPGFYGQQISWDYLVDKQSGGHTRSPKKLNMRGCAAWTAESANDNAAWFGIEVTSKIWRFSRFAH